MPAPSSDVDNYKPLNQHTQMGPVVTRANRYSFVNIVCYWVIFFSSVNLFKLLSRAGAAERNIKPLSSSVANHLSEWQLNVFESVQKLLQHHVLLLVISILIAIVAIILAVFAIKRSEWARKGLIGLFALKAVTIIVTFAYTLFTTSILINYVTDRVKDIPVGAGSPPFGFLPGLMALVAGLVTIALLIVYVWIIKRLRSEAVRSQFMIYNS